jgi:hypothetical protein
MSIVFNDLMEYTTALATIGTMIAAFQALGAWKEQLIANRYLELHSRIITVISEWQIFTIELCVENQNGRVLRETLETNGEFLKEREKTNQKKIDETTLKLKSLHTTIKYGTKLCKNQETLLDLIDEAIKIQTRISTKVKNSSLSTYNDDFPLLNVSQQMEKIAKASMYLMPPI